MLIQKTIALKAVEKLIALAGNRQLELSARSIRVTSLPF